MITSVQAGHQYSFPNLQRLATMLSLKNYTSHSSACIGKYWLVWT